ncbi:MAG: hypothetical protein HY758_06405 [Nitrospirae bacterium]|nr:hypothetical protein [Nitrospirota bacterium]
MEKIKLVSLRDILYIFFKNKNMIFLTFLIAVVASLVYVIFASPVYIAETKILVKIGREKFTEIDAYSKESYNILFQERTQNISNEIEILKEPYLTKKVFPKFKEKLQSMASGRKETFFGLIRSLIHLTVKKTKDILLMPIFYLGLSQKLTEDEEIAQLFANSLHAEPLEDTDIIKLTFKWDNPEFAAYAADAYASAYVAQHIKVNQSEESHNFYIEQINLYGKQLEELENELENILKENNISEISIQKEILLKEISEVQKKLNETIMALDNIKIKNTEIGAMHKKPDSWIETPNIGKLGAEFTNLKILDDIYFKLKAERDGLLEDFKPESREIQSIDSQLYKIRSQKTESLFNILSVEAATISNEIALLGKDLAEKKNALDKLDRLSLRLIQIERSKNIAQNNYLLYKKKAEELRISDDLNKQRITSVKIINPALQPLQPVYPKKKLVLSLAALLGLFVGFGYSFIYEYFNHTFKDGDDVSAYLEIPLLMSIPHINDKNKKS